LGFEEFCDVRDSEPAKPRLEEKSHPRKIKNFSLPGVFLFYGASKVIHMVKILLTIILKTIYLTIEKDLS